ncbi:rRNA maturation RNase YbeY [Anderseniella sp. Alg231-50]|uniref:rRNA maturation RNase YbeY n=1 Tax=Anderseniella sp. Alg231-50 TaxID=1922226 RepID=UPI00307CA778
MILEIEVDRTAWQELSDPEILLRQAAQATEAALDTDLSQTVLTVSLATDDEVAGLNQQWRNKAGPTNVLSFPAARDMPLPPGEPRPLGDIMLAAGVVKREAAEQGKSLEHHLVHLAVHGILHIMDYDHINEAEATEMESLEVDILNVLGIANPYT